MKKIINLLKYLWLGIWAMITILMYLAIIYFAITFYPEFKEMGILQMCGLSIMGLLMIGLLISLGYTILQLILSINTNNE